ncbi:MAG: CvpA family protein [Oscillospiraceae bacterium]|nr:CvpA family protein [Oscillospiraceae bacterium]MBR0392670.1 CvpA family protein [Oscillospiraceae bacterium]
MTVISIILDLLLLLIVAMCIWHGYRRGIVGGVLSLAALLIALLGGSSLSDSYSYQVNSALEPFVEGYIDSQLTRDEVLDAMGYGNTDLSLEDVLERDSSLRWDYAFLCFEHVGFHERRSEELAEDTVTLADTQDLSMTEAVITILCDTISYVAGLTLAFLLILIVLTVVGSIGSLVFRLPPNLELLDEIGGALMGFIKGFLYGVLLTWILSFLGLAIGKETLDNSLLARFFLNLSFLTRGLL